MIAAVYGDTFATCPRCGGNPNLSCCVCHGARVLRWFSDLARAMEDVWRLRGCHCEACAALPWPMERTEA